MLFVKTLEMQPYANVLQLIPVTHTSIADLIHVLIQLAVKIQNVLQVDNVHCADVSEDSLEIQTAGPDATLTHVQLTIHVEKEPNVKIPEDDQYVHALQDMQAIHTLDVFEELVYLMRNVLIMKLVRIIIVSTLVQHLAEEELTAALKTMSPFADAQEETLEIHSKDVENSPETKSVKPVVPTQIVK